MLTFCEIFGIIDFGAMFAALFFFGETKMKRIVIALGGNALQEAGKPATAESQLEVVEKTSEYIADIIESGYDVVLAHGNGPQVGRIVLQNEYASAVTPAMPFDVAVQ